MYIVLQKSNHPVLVFLRRHSAIISILTGLGMLVWFNYNGFTYINVIFPLAFIINGIVLLINAYRKNT
ncbi:MAG: hypothetical protein LBT80_06015 [Lactobacillaceae bacterium]|nr:hypothetical protein [Lactobacillaceae bacterium]